MQLEQLKELCRCSALKWSTHCLERMQERDISREDVKSCIMDGEVIEDYPADFPHPSCLLFGYTIGGKALHVVAGTDGTYLYVVTAYLPNTEKFEIGLKTRKGRT